MKVPFVDLHAQYLSIKAEIDEAIASVIRESGFIRSRFVDNFEEQFALMMGVNSCVSCANGTDALYILFRALGVKSGDEVITTAHSWISTSETITQAGGRVVFCDTDGETFTICPKQIESKITSRTVGLVPVHLFGQPADMDAIMDIAKRHNLWVVEDCAQAHLAEYKGKKAGTFGNASTFSFYPGKNLGAMGDAGCILTNDTNLANWCAAFARHGGKGDHRIEGINSRMDGMQAAILSAKLPHLQKWTSARQIVANHYGKFLSSLDSIATPGTAEWRTHVYHLYVIKSKKRNALRDCLRDRCIDTVLNYPKALPFYPAYEYLGHQPSDFPNAFKDQNEILSLPIYPELDEEMVRYVCECIMNFSVDN